MSARSSAAGRDVALWASIRASVSTFTDDIARFVALNAIWGATAILAALVAQLHVVGALVFLSLVPTTAALGRVASVAARGGLVRLTDARRGAVHRWPGAMALGAAQLAVFAIGYLNVQIGLASAAAGLVIAGVAAAWVVLIVAVLSVATWPLLLDPDRDGTSTRTLARLALAVVAERPGRMLAITLLAAALLLVILQTVIGALFLPAFLVLVAAHVVLPVADRVEGRTAEDGPSQPSI